MQVIKLFLRRLKAFRPTPVALVLFVVATVRMALSGSAIGLAGVCAGIVPYICVCGGWEHVPEAESSGVLADWLCGAAFAALYLAWMLLVTLTASVINPIYAPEPLLISKLALALAGDAVFVSVAYPLCTLLPQSVRLLPGIVLVNVQIAFMLLCDALGVAAQPWALAAGLGFAALVSAVALGLVLASRGLYAKQRLSAPGC